MTTKEDKLIVRTNLARYLKANSGKRNRQSFMYRTPYAEFEVWPILGKPNDWRIRLVVPEEDLPPETA